MPNLVDSVPRKRAPISKRRRDLADLMRPLQKQSHQSGNFFESPLPRFEHCGNSYSLPRYIFIGPPGGTTHTRVGIFGSIHGDEPAGAHAIVRLLTDLIEHPEHALGIEIFAYPICNPTGLEDGTRWSRSGIDLNREFWRDSSEPEVILLERQLRNLNFDGIIALHADDTSDGIYGYANGDTLTRNLLEPGLRAAERYLPRNRTETIDGWAAQDGIIDEGYVGVLSAPPSQKPKPFEIIFETPHLADSDRQVSAMTSAMLAIFEANRELQAHAANI